jgi:solute carrier family 30 (zinc transporter), member 1
MSIFLEAIQRFVEPQVVSKPKLVMIVGCLGLASNILGLMLFHDHGHGHSHGTKVHDDDNHAITDAEEGYGHNHKEQSTSQVADERGNVADILPQAAVGAWRPRSHSNANQFSSSDADNTTATPTRAATLSTTEPRSHRPRTSGSFGRGFGSFDHILSHPAYIRHDIINASRLEEHSESEPEEEAVVEDSGPSSPNENSTLLKHADGSPRKRLASCSAITGGHKRSKSREHRHDSWHADHHHAKPRAEGGKGHGHSHGDLNMRGVFLHVMGDALGNIGVIASALFIWLTTYSWRYYVDPAISLMITMIILASAIPLCKAASRILLQAVPIGLNVDEIKSDIEELPGVVSCHHLHVWQLSDTKIVASLHVQVDCEVEGDGSASYMHLARQVRRCLHGFGIHSSTIQPEFCLQKADDEQSPISGSTARGEGSGCSPTTGPGGKSSKAGSLSSEPSACLLDCGDECAGKDQCCPLPIAKK